MMISALDEHELAAIESTAVKLAEAAGAMIRQALGGELTVRYKQFDDADVLFRDPVSDVDERVEALIREEVGRQFPTHAVLGEEGTETSGGPVLWAIDPIDGTTNFVNGFPMFCASIGVLLHGKPIAGALWCSSTHALLPGTYHARIGRSLSFGGQRFRPSMPSDVRRRLIGLPALPAEGQPLEWDVRKTGSAALECAFVSTRSLDGAYFASPNVWDVAAGVALLEAAGCSVQEWTGTELRSFNGFGATMDEIKEWRAPLGIGSQAAIQKLVRYV